MITSQEHVNYPNLVQEFVSSQVGKSDSCKKQARIVSNAFLQSLKSLNPPKWTKMNLFNFLTELENYSRNTQYVYQVQLKAFLRLNGRENLAILVKPPKRPEILKVVPSKDEVERMINVSGSFRDKLIVLILSRTGLRVGELCHINPSDIDLEKRQIRIRVKEDWSPKGLKERVVPIDSETANKIRFYLRRYSRKRLIDLSESQIRRIVKNLAFKAQVIDANKISPHSIRHAFAVQFLTHGGDVRSLQKILGHTDLATTAIYLDLSEKQITQAYDRVFEQVPNRIKVLKRKEASDP